MGATTGRGLMRQGGWGKTPPPMPENAFFCRYYGPLATGPPERSVKRWSVSLRKTVSPVRIDEAPSDPFNLFFFCFPDTSCMALGLRRTSIILLAMLAAAIVSVGALHRQILRATAGALIVDQQAAEFDWLCLMPLGGLHVEGDDACPIAARLCREMPSRRVLLVEPPAMRIVQVNAVPSFRVNMEKDFQRYDIPWSAVEMLPIASERDQVKVEALGAWLERHPQSRVQLLCDRFRSRCWRMLLDKQLTPDQAGRVSLRALPQQEYDETNWWRKRSGIRDLMLESLAILYTWSPWKDGEARLPSDPEGYERRFLECLQERKPR
jgi:hypothetical protein